jgi:hypothetical protein
MKDNVDLPSGKTLDKFSYRGLYFRIFISIISAHIIVVYGEAESLFFIILTKAYYIALISSTVIAFILISYIHFVNGKLNQQLDWHNHTWQRIGYQLVLALCVPGMLEFFMASLYFQLNGVNILDTVYLRLDFPFIMTLLFCLNLYYILVYLIDRIKAIEKINQHDELLLNKRSPETIAVPDFHEDTDHIIKVTYLVNTPLKIIPLHTEQISYFFRMNGHNFLHTFSSDEVYTIPESLKDIEEQFCGEQFFRINRQMILNFTACVSYRSGKNKTIELTIHPPFSRKYRDEGTLNGSISFVTVSEDRVQAFREWMDR